MKVLKTDVSVCIHSLRNIDIVTEGFMFVVVDFEHPQPPGLVAVRLNNYVSLVTDSTYLHPEYPPAIADNGMRTAVFALRYADQLIDVGLQMCFSLFYLYTLDASACMTISLYGRAQKTGTMPSSDNLPISAFKRLIKKRYRLNMLIIPGILCFSEHLSYTFFAHLGMTISWYPAEVMLLEDDKIQSLIGTKQHSLDDFFEYLLSNEQTLYPDDLVNIADAKARNKLLSLPGGDELAIKDILSVDLTVPSPVGNSICALNSALFNQCQTSIEVHESLNMSTSKDYSAHTPNVGMILDEAGSGAHFSTNIGTTNLSTPRTTGMLRKMITCSSQLAQLLAQSDNIINISPFPMLQRSTLIFFKMFYLTKIANVRITGIIDNYIQRYSDATDIQINNIYVTECKRYTHLVVKASSSSLAAIAYENLTYQFEQKITGSVGRDSLSTSMTKSLPATALSTPNRQPQPQPQQQQQSYSVQLNAIPLPEASTGFPTVHKQLTDSRLTSSCTCNADYAQWLLKQEAARLQEAKDTCLKRVIMALTRNPDVDSVHMPLLLEKTAGKRRGASSRTPRASRSRRSPSLSPVALNTGRSSTPKKEAAASRNPTSIEVAMMKTIKGSSERSKFISDNVPSSDYVLSPALSNSEDTRASQVKNILQAIEAFRSQHFQIEPMRTQESITDIFRYPSICRILSNRSAVATPNLPGSVPNMSIVTTIKETRQYKDLYVFAHGYRGTYCDLRLMSDCITQYAVIKGTMEKHLFTKQPCLLLSKSYQNCTNKSILELGVKLAEEIRAYIQARKFSIKSINMIGHSMGCLVIEACLLTTAFSGFLGILNKLVFLNGPLAGAKSSNGLVRFGMSILSSNNKEVSLRELTGGKVSKKQVESIYQKYQFMSTVTQDKELLKYIISTPLLEILAEYSNLHRFQSIYLISSLQDGYVNFKSALLLSDERKRKSDNGKGKDYVFLNKLKNTPTKRLLYDLSTLNPILAGSSRMDRQTGRDAHIVHMSDYNLMHTLVQETFYKDI